MSGREVRGLGLEEVRSRIAVVDDEPHAFAGSVRANLCLAVCGREPTNRELLAPDHQPPDHDLVAALEAVDLGHWFGTLPGGLDTPLTGLSGGERARLSLARALLSRRPLVLLDEPTAHLDEATARRAMTGFLGALAPGTAVILVDHAAQPHDSAGWRRVELARSGLRTPRHAAGMPIG